MKNFSKINLLKSEELALSDRRLFNYLLHHAFATLKTQTHFSINIDALTGVFGATTPSIEQLKRSLCRLQRLIVNFETDNKDNTWVQTPLLSTVEIDTQHKILHFSYTTIACKLLVKSEILEQLLIQAHFEYKYSITLYELLTEAVINNQREFSIETLELRIYLNIDEDKLKNFNDFNRFALQPAIAEINAYASFTIILSTKRKGRKVTHLVFNIQRKHQIQQKLSAKYVIPVKRPHIFIEDPEKEKLYSRILMASTAERNKFFTLAKKKATTAGVALHTDDFDTPDTWFKWLAK